MYKIGNVEIKSKVILAPMAGVTSLAYRNFMKPFGVGLTVTEMVSDCGLIYENKKTLEYVKTTELERPIAIQLFGNSAETILKAMKICEKENPDFDFFDINLGCPVPKVTKAGSGSSLLKDPAKLGQMFKKICEKATKSVTAKIRLGWSDDSINFLENIKALEDAGVAMVSAEVTMIPQNYVKLTDEEELKNLNKTLDLLDEDDDVQSVYTNLEE